MKVLLILILFSNIAISYGQVNLKGEYKETDHNEGRRKASKIKSITHYSFSYNDSLKNKWETKKIYTEYFDKNGLLIKVITEPNELFKKKVYNIYHYNNYGLIYERLNYLDTLFVSKTSLNYNKENKVIEYIESTPFSNNIFKNIYKYDNQSNLIEEIECRDDSCNSLRKYIYDNDNNLIKEYYRILPNVNSDTNWSIINYSYIFDNKKRIVEKRTLYYYMQEPNVDTYKYNEDGYQIEHVSISKHYKMQSRNV